MGNGTFDINIGLMIFVPIGLRAGVALYDYEFDKVSFSFIFMEQ
jgi:hypothetical protein